MIQASYSGQHVAVPYYRAFERDENVTNYDGDAGLQTSGLINNQERITGRKIQEYSIK